MRRKGDRHDFSPSPLKPHRREMAASYTLASVLKYLGKNADPESIAKLPDRTLRHLVRTSTGKATTGRMTSGSFLALEAIAAVVLRGVRNDVRHLPSPIST